jgi:hypothetical protein
MCPLCIHVYNFFFILLTAVDRKLPIAMSSFYRKNLSFIWSSDIKRCHDGLDLRDVPFCQCVSAV